MSVDRSNNETLHRVLDTNFYLESPLLNYGFIKLPRIEFSHEQEILVNKISKNPSFIEAVEKYKKYIYPLYFNHRFTKDILEAKGYTNLFVLNGSYTHKDEESRVFAYFIINNNDNIEGYLQAFCELYAYVDNETTKEKMELFNKPLYDLMDFDLVIEKLEEMGVIKEQDIRARAL